MLRNAFNQVSAVASANCKRLFKFIRKVVGLKNTNWSVIDKHVEQFEPKVRDQIYRLMRWSDGGPIDAFYAAIKMNDELSFRVAMGIVDSPFCGINHRFSVADNKYYRFNDALVPIIIAAEAERVDVIAALVSKGANVNAYDAQGNTALRKATLTMNYAAVELLLVGGADVNWVNPEDGRTAFFFAAQNGDMRTMSLLIAKGADIHVRDKHQQTPLHCAATYGRTLAIYYLACLGADISCQDNDHRTPLHKAIMGSFADSVLALLLYGADINAVDRNNFTPLHMAAFYDAPDISKILLSLGADCEAGEETVLLVASMIGSPECIEILAAEGANIYAQALNGDTPLRVFESSGVDVSPNILSSSEIARVRSVLAPSRKLSSM